MLRTAQAAAVVVDSPGVVDSGAELVRQVSAVPQLAAERKRWVEVHPLAPLEVDCPEPVIRLATERLGRATRG